MAEKKLAKSAGSSSRALQLSPRELQILRLRGEGRSYKEIATRLEISEHTVGSYMRRITAKTGTNSSAMAVYRVWLERRMVLKINPCWTR